MLFALDNDDGALHAFASEDEAIAHCKGVDVLDGYWRFFNEDGSPLEARPIRGATPANGVPPSVYILERAMSGLWLQERLAQIRGVSGCGLTSVDELVEVLKLNRAKRVQRDSLRRG